jgi:hypothetical protein
VSAAIVVEAMLCVAVVPMSDGNEMSLLRFNGETITATLAPSRGGLERGETYEVTFRKVAPPSTT